MNLKTTLVMALLLLVGGASWFGYHRSRPIAPSPEAQAVLGKELSEDTITRIEIVRRASFSSKATGSGRYPANGRFASRK